MNATESTAPHLAHQLDKELQEALNNCGVNPQLKKLIAEQLKKQGK